MTDDANKDQLEGTTDQAKGSVKEGLGEIRGDEDQQAEGQMDQTKGGLKEKMGEAKNKASDMINKVKDNN